MGKKITHNDKRLKHTLDKDRRLQMNKQVKLRIRFTAEPIAKPKLQNPFFKLQFVENSIVGKMQ